MVLCEFTMFPTDKGASVSPWVARLLARVDASGLPYRLTPMSTIVEGDWDAVMALVTACFRDLEGDCGRINVSLKVDYRAGTESRISAKVEKIEALLGRKLST
jgi:uncharacterized protein (TIGR00106 family)